MAIHRSPKADKPQDKPPTEHCTRLSPHSIPPSARSHSAQHERQEDRGHLIIQLYNLVYFPVAAAVDL